MVPSTASAVELAYLVVSLPGSSGSGQRDWACHLFNYSDHFPPDIQPNVGVPVANLYCNILNHLGWFDVVVDVSS